MFSVAFACTHGKAYHRSNATADNATAVSSSKSPAYALTNPKSHARPVYNYADDCQTDKYALNSNTHILDMHQRCAGWDRDGHRLRWRGLRQV